MAIRHKITNVDEQARMGSCSVCGVVNVVVGPLYQGRTYWRCGPARRTDEQSRYRTLPHVAERQREVRFLKTYGITPEEYDRRLVEQGGVCARCKEEPKTLRLAVDHCHTTGRVRGLLCGPCNTYLGRLEANLTRLLDDMLYLDAQPIATRL